VWGMSTLTIERIGGLAGFGAPGGHLRSRGEVPWEQLSAQDRKAVEALFARHRSARQSPSPARDAFVYRLSKGVETIEVGEEQIPATLLQHLKDELV
jgi:hypothetical protein